MMRLLLLAGTISAAAQASSPPPPAVSPDVIARMQQTEVAARSLPDPRGTGPYAALKEEAPSLPDHVIYRPADLAGLGRARLPIVVWGNGGCAGDGAGQRQHLLELASHGYLVIANGRIQSGPGMSPPPARPTPPPGPNGEFVPPPPETHATQLTQAIDWAIGENKRRGSRYFRHLDPKAVAVSGWSCGGIQALTVGVSDPRIKTIVIHNSGTFPDGARKQPEIELPKAALRRIRVPIIYILGGATDIAYPNGMDDYARLIGVPAAVVNLDVGHLGTFFQPSGGMATTVAAAWLDWRLKGSAAAAKMFSGANCSLCRNPQVSYAKKGF